MNLTAFEGTYCGPAPDPAVLGASWNLDPLLLLCLAAFALLNRKSRPGLAGVVVLAVAFASPLCALSSALFSGRVVHHLLLVVVAGPLIAGAWPTRGPLSPVLPFLVSAATLWMWHLPQTYDGALGNKLIYWLMQATLLGTFVVFWQSILHRAQPIGAAMLFTFAAYLQMSVLGALLTFAPDPLYAIHMTAPLAFGITPLADQQLGGLIMWVPGGLPFLVLGGLVARRGWRAAGAVA